MKPSLITKLLLFTLLGFSLTTGDAFGYSSGDRVQCTGTNVNVRSCPSTACSVNGQVNSPTLGTVQSGPYSGDGFTWYFVNWDTGISGYTVQDFFKLFSALTITSTAFDPPTGTVGVPYGANTALMATGGTQPYTWSATGLPGGMSLNATTGALFGTPTQAGSYNINVTVKDSSSPQQTASKVIPFTVNSGTSTLTITSTAFDPPTGTVGVPYGANTALTATGGTQPYTWSATGLPGGMSLNATTGALFGTPTQAGTFNINVTVKDSSNPQQSASKVIPFTVNSGTSTLTITSTAFDPPTGTVGVPYGANTALMATGGTQPYTWSATGLPGGMSLNATTGALFGTPTQAGSYNINVTVKDSSSPQQTASKVIPFTVNSGTSTLTITSTAFDPPTGTVGVPYGANTALMATGGTQPYTWSATGLPGGMSLNATTGALFGTPTQSGSFSINVTVKDSSSPQQSASKVIPFTVNSGTSTLTITSPAFDPPTGTVGVPYGANTALMATGGTQPYTWSATGLPAGMSLNSTFGTLFGTPTQAGSYNINVTVKDSNGPQQTASKVMPFTVGAGGSGDGSQPDLVASQVIISPLSVKINDPISVSLSVTNQGAGSAVATTTRIRINASTTTTSPADVALGDINTPTIAAGQTVSIAGNFTMPPLASGTYYIWVSLDNTDVANESDGTNDYAHSPGIMVIGSADGAPIIESLTQSPNSDETVTLSVIATAKGALSYQWSRDGKTIVGATGSATRVSLAGDYSVDVTAGVTIHSQVLHVDLSPPSPPSFQPTTGLLKPLRFPISETADTIVLTHGWQPGVDSSQWTNVPANIQSLADAILARLPAANVFVYLWKEAYTAYGVAGPAYASTPSAGAELAKQLAASLPGYNSSSHSVQFIGHSFGTFVNAYAVSGLNWHVKQFTLLDAPINPEAWIGVGLTDANWLPGPPSASAFYSSLPTTQVDWVDSYIALLPFNGFQFGGAISGAAPNGGELVDGVNHTSIVGGFYTPTVFGGSDGFNHSALVNNGNSDLSRWQPGSLGDRIFDNLITAGLPILGNVAATVELVGQGLSNVWKLTNIGASKSEAIGQQSTNSATETGTDAAVEFSVAVPQDATALEFDFRFAAAGDGDWATLDFNGVPIFSFLASAFDGEQFEHVSIPVSNVIGQSGLFTATLHAESNILTDFRLANLRFTNSQVVSTNPPMKFANISTRLSVGLGDDVLIGGFIITGTQPKRVMLRAIGPSLNALGVSGALADPMLELYDAKGQIVTTNDNWRDSVNPQDMLNSTIAPTNDKEAAILITLEPGAYTAVLRGSVGSTGVGLVEAYDLDSGTDSKFANISTRGSVQNGEDVMIGGFIVTGDAATKTLIRAIGPSLPVSGVLADPTLELHDGNGAIIASNDNWKDSQKSDIEATTIPPANDQESAIVSVLSPGAYTAIVRGTNNSTGVALVEAYQLDK